MICTAVVPASFFFLLRRGILKGPALQYFYIIHRCGRNLTANVFISKIPVLGREPAFMSEEKSIFFQAEGSTLPLVMRSREEGHCLVMMMIAFITFKSSLVPLLEGL